MISLTRLLLGQRGQGDHLRYDRGDREPWYRSSEAALKRRPVVVWNVTGQCNLRCAHCYAASGPSAGEDELTTDEGVRLLKDLADFGVPVVLFSGGEPLLRPDLPRLAEHAVRLGLRAVVSTNGTCLTRELASRLKDVGVSYVGVSLDGLEDTNDEFRGVRGAFQQALEGLRNCREIGLRVGLRFTVSRRNVSDLEGVLDLCDQEEIPRCCVYHLAYAGRGAKLAAEDLSPQETREVVELLCRRVQSQADGAPELELLTVDNHCDGIYAYLKLVAEDSSRAGEVAALLSRSGGNSSGVGIGCVDERGDVHPDQFWRSCTLGNVRERPFGQIWTDLSNAVLRGLKHRAPLIKGRCAADHCRWFDWCNGNLRLRAEAAGDLWGPDPACYLTDAEIGR